MSRIAFLFPGQGAQFIGMAKALCESAPAARELFAKATDVLGYDLLDICVNGPADKLNSTAISQPAIYVASLAALEALKAADPSAVAACEATAGLSLGEYTALVFAGAIGFQDGLKVVQRRGEAMQAAADATPSGMISILSLDRPAVEQLCIQACPAGSARIANFLCPGNLVVSGTRAACDEIERLATATGARTIRLAVAGAFHTPIMKPADDALAAVLASVALAACRIPVWSNVDAQPHTEPQEIRELLVRQVVNPVLWEDSMRGLMAAGIDRFYEIGPGRVLAGLLKRIHRKVDCQNVAV